MIDTPYNGEPATWNEDILLEPNRYGFAEETHFTITYSPIPDDSVPNGIGGVLATVNEITEKVIGERRIVTLRDLGARVGEARTAEEACRIAANTLSGHDRDLPFVLLYLIDEQGKQARLAGMAGVSNNEEFCPPVVDLSAARQSGWPLAAAIQYESMQVVENLRERFSSVPPGPWSDPPDTAVVVPIPSNKIHEPAGLMVAGVSARLKLDRLYQDFIGLVRNQIATAIANARVYEQERRRADESTAMIPVIPLSAQVQEQARLAESEERYRGIVNQSVGAIAEADSTGLFTTVNDHFCQMTGYTRQELLNLRMLDLTHPKDLARSKELLEKLTSGGEPYTIEKRYLRKDGSVIWVRKSVSAIRDAGGVVKSLIAVLIDITKSKQTEIALQQMNLQLENMVQDRTAELRATNQSLREEIAERIRVEEQLNLHRNRLRQLSRRLVEVQEEERRAIARELHDRAGQTLSALNINLTIMNQQLSPETKLRIGERMHDSMKLTTEVIRLIRTVVSDLRPTVLYDYGLQAALVAYIGEYQSRYGIRIRLEAPGTILPSVEPGVAMTVLRLLQDALMNVVRHARARQVRVSLRLTGQKIHLRVQDDGVGIADVMNAGWPDSHGLRIMRERAEAFGGSVNVEPAPKRGTRLDAYIPIQTQP